MDYRKRRTEHAPILIDEAVVEQVESCNKLEWNKTHQDSHDKAYSRSGN